MVKSRYIGDGHPTFNWNPYIGYTIGLMTIPYHREAMGQWDPSTYECVISSLDF